MNNMPWNANEDEAFPARHPREPGGLRQDILDEISDHLACAAEREQEKDEGMDEDTVWRRVLERFGNPNTLARRLWWAQMRETVMREWIQTGVLAMLAIVGAAGIVLIFVMMGRLNQTNDAMEMAMKQVATTNEALLKVLSGLPAGGANTESLDLSTIDVVVRRGTPDGPPATEVRLLMKGKGPNEETMNVEGEMDAEGHNRFERLAQGNYELSFYDPRSDLSMIKEITLFAGKGAGEYIVVAPDVKPRPVYFDWGLPAYGRDDEVMIGCDVTAHWDYEGSYWSKKYWVLSGRDATWLNLPIPAGAPRPAVGATTRPRGLLVPPVDERKPCLMAGELKIANVASMETNSDGSWGGPSGVQLNEAPTLVSDDESGARYRGVLPDVVRESYSIAARIDRSQEFVSDPGYSVYLANAVEQLPETIVVAAESVTDHQWGLWKNGGIAGFEEGERNEIEFEPHYDTQHALILPVSEKMMSGSGAYLALQNKGIQMARMEKSSGGGVKYVHDRRQATGNTLAAYALRAGAGEATAMPALDPTPFWQAAIEELVEDNDSRLLIEVPQRVFEDQANPVTGILVKWEEGSTEFQWVFRTFVEGDEIDTRPCWLVTAPAEGTAQPPSES